ncbi:MAG: ParA family protein [Actinomycetota bacterium]|nr:ParA family protein [Actinomycetota bacterium]
MTRVIALFNNKGGVGKTTLAYHLAHMVSRQGHPTLAVDLDPQANLTSAFFDDDALEAILDSDEPITVRDAVDPRLRGLGDIVVPPPREVADQLWVLPGDLGLSNFEDALSGAWPHGYEGDEAALRTTTAFHRIVQGGARAVGAEVVFVDVGPNLGAINRAALLAADHVVVPLAADLYSLRGLANVGPVLRRWRTNWQENVVPKAAGLDLDVPSGAMEPMGYVVLQHAVRLDRPVKAYDRFLKRIPGEFARSVLEAAPPRRETAAGDPHCLATLRNYRSLMPLAQDARKPMFDLRAADGALGSTGRLVSICFREFEGLAASVLDHAGIEVRA